MVDEVYDLPYTGDQTAEYLAKARDFSGEVLGNGLYQDGKVYTNYQQYLNDNGALFKLNPSIEAPYNVDLTTYGLAKDDPNLIPYTSFESASTEAIAEFEDSGQEAIENLNDVTLGAESFNSYVEFVSDFSESDSYSVTTPDGKIVRSVSGANDDIDQSIRLVDGYIPEINIKDFDSVQGAIDYAVALGARDIICNDDYVVPLPVLSNRTNVTFVGTGSITGPGSYGARVFPYNASKSVPTFSNLDAEVHLPVLQASNNRKIVFCGDSLSTEIASSNGRSETLWFRLQKKLAADMGSYPIVINRAVGGNTWADVNDVANTSLTAPKWYVDRSKAWLDYVEEEEPDAVFLSFGMNDKEDFAATNVKEVVEKIKLWDKVPDIVFVTNFCPSIETGIAGYADETSQEGRDIPAGWVRTYALRNGYGFLDMNRSAHCARDGFDIRNSSMVDHVVEENTSSGRYVSDVACRDFYFANTVPGTGAEVLAKYQGSQPVSFRIGRNAGDLLFVTAVGSLGNATFRYAIYSDGLVTGVTTDVLVPENGHFLEVAKQDNQIIIGMLNSVTAEYSEIAVIRNVITHGGLFFPVAGYYANGSDGPFGRINFKYGQHKLNKPIITNDEMFGDSTATGTGNQRPYGGNGVNHPTSRGIKAIYDQVLDSTQFSVKSKAKEVYRGTSNRFLGLQVSATHDGSEGAYVGGVTANNLTLLSQDTKVITVAPTFMSPITTGTMSMGQFGFRYTTGYFVNSPDVSSDKTMKEQIRDLTDAESSAAKSIAKLPKMFKWISEVEQKGDGAYLHCSPMAQSVWDALESEGLDPTMYGFVSDGGEDGTYSLQPQELLWMIVQAQQATLDAFEERLKALE